jgi:T5SS/PEP-CTERM-associated repeat protein
MNSKHLHIVFLNVSHALMLMTATLAIIPRAGLFAADGSASDPYLNDAVDYSTLDQGGNTAAYAYNYINDGNTYSLDTNAYTYVGRTTSYNYLLVNSGSTITSEAATIGLGYTVTGGVTSASTADNNVVVIEEAPLSILGALDSSTWTVEGRLTVGDCASDNFLYLNEGGYVSCLFLRVGVGDTTNSFEASGNGIVLSGYAAGNNQTQPSTLDVLSQAILGYSELAGGNSITVQNGAAFSCGTNLTIGCEGDSNSVTLIGPAQNSTGVTLDAGLYLYLGEKSADNKLTASGGAVIEMSKSMEIGIHTSADDNVASLTGEGTAMTIGSGLNVGELGNRNRVTLSDGASVTIASTCYLGMSEIPYTLSEMETYEVLGNNNRIDVTGADGLNENTSFTAMKLYIGFCGSNNRFHVSEGGEVATLDGDVVIGYYGTNLYDSGTSAYLGTFASSGNSLVVSGEYSDLRPAYSGGSHADIFVGQNGSTNTLKVTDEGSIVCGDLYIGYGTSGEDYLGCDNTVTISGSGSSIRCYGSIFVGWYGTGNTVVLANTGLMRCEDFVLDYDSEDSTVESYLCLAGGYLAIDGDVTTYVGNIAGAGHIKVWDSDSQTWITASASDITCQYFDNDTDAMAFCGYDSQGDCTIVTGGGAIPDLDWADVNWDIGSNGWYDSAFFGWFYTTYAYDGWIWHCNHGWQYIYSSSTTDGVYLWDCATASWWYTSQTCYPFIFQFTYSNGIWGGAWYDFMGGSTPNRKFWDYATNGEISESAIAQ